MSGFPELSRIDWPRPWLAPLLPVALPLLETDDWRSALNFAAAESDLRNHRGLPLRFVEQAELPVGTAYEAFISETGRVPTRSNLHDFFNALMWLRFPCIKAGLNRLQSAEITRAETHPAAVGKRGKLRDGATIFDENAALFITSDPAVAGSLREHRWEDLFISQRKQFGVHVDVVLFGHALIEKLVVPYKAITGHAWIIPVEPEFFLASTAEQRLWVDRIVANQIDGGLSTFDFNPLPILGVPGWWQGQDLDYYRDVDVFRPKRAAPS